MIMHLYKPYLININLLIQMQMIFLSFIQIQTVYFSDIERSYKWIKCNFLNFSKIIIEFNATR